MLVLSGIHLDWYGCRAVFSGMLICANDALAALATIRTCRTLQYGYILAYGIHYSVSVCTAYCDAYQLHENSNFASGPGVVMYNTWIPRYCTIC